MGESGSTYKKTAVKNSIMHKNKNNNKKSNKKISLTNQKHRIQIVNLISCIYSLDKHKKVGL